MPIPIEQITDCALALAEPERAQLAQTLLRSLDPDPMETGVEEAWNAEIARRLERVQQGVAHGRPAEEVFRDLRARCQG